MASHCNKEPAKKHQREQEIMSSRKISKQTSLIGGGFSGGSVVKTLSTKQERWVQSLGQEDPLEKDMAKHSSICYC